MTEAKFNTTRDGDAIVIRLPLAAIAAAMLSSGNALGGPVEIVDGDALLNEIVAQMNDCNGVEAMILEEVSAAMDDDTQSVRALPNPVQSPYDPTRRPSHMFENVRDIALAELRANGLDLPTPNARH